MNTLNNRIEIKGNIGNIQQLHSQQSDDTGVELSVATEDNAYYDKNDERVSQQGWHKVVSWGPVGNSIFERADVGDKIQIEGQLKYQDWTDDNDNQRKTAFVKVKSFDIIRKKSREEAAGE